MATYSTGSYPSGAPTLNISGVSYVCNTWNGPNKTTNTAQINNGAGERVGANSVTGPATATAELQLATSSTALPNTAAENATAGVFVGPDNANYFITAVSPARQAGPQQWTVTIQAERVT